MSFVHIVRAGAGLAGGWLLKKGGDKAGDALFKKGEQTVKNKASASECRRNAQRHARQIGGRWSGPVLLDRTDRWIVWDKSGQPHEMYPQSVPELSKQELATHKDLADFAGERHDPPPTKAKKK